jgi:hypothetical protein
MNFIKHSIFSLTFIFLASLASAKELKSDELNCGIIIPDGWTVVFQNQAGFSVASQDRKRTMTLLIRGADFSQLDSNSVAIIDRDFLKVGCTKISSRIFTIDGIPAYEIVQQIGKAPFASSYVDHIIIAIINSTTLKRCMLAAMLPKIPRYKKDLLVSISCNRLNPQA